jgi:hypothetical protein
MVMDKTGALSAIPSERSVSTKTTVQLTWRVGLRDPESLGESDALCCLLIACVAMAEEGVRLRRGDFSHRN